MASALIAEKDADRDVPVPCQSSAQTSPSRRRFLGDGDLDILLRKAGLALDAVPGADGGDAGGEDDGSGRGGRRPSDGDCRVGQCRMPGMIQRLATVHAFTTMCCALAALTGALTAGYVNSVITTIEKRFEIGSSFSGLIAASVEIGGVLSAIVVSYLGGRRHIPSWIGFGAIVMSVGTLLFTVPHMMTPAYTVTGGLNSSRHPGIDGVCRPSSLDNRYVKPSHSADCLSRESGQPNYVLTLVLAQLLIGIGGSPLYTLGTAYIDNHVDKRKAPSYIAFIYASGVFGPLLGFALGALMLQYYVDLLSFSTVDLKLTSSNPRWVGAWWAGFLFIGSLFFIVSLPFFGFPRVLLRELRQLARDDPARLDLIIEQNKKRQHTGDCSANDAGPSSAAYGKNLRDFPAAVWHLLTNPVYIVTCFGICCEVSIVSGFVVFLPKYLETEFGATKSAANLLTGGSAIPGAVVGILVGGYCLRQFQLTRKGAVQLTLVLNAVALMGFGVFFSLGCDNYKVAGVTVPYPSTLGGDTVAGAEDQLTVNLTSSCNAACNCNDNRLEPVCGANMIVYFSPCYAGCTWLHSSPHTVASAHILNYSNCACIVQDLGRQLEAGVTMTTVSASSDMCRGECATLLPFMIMLFFMTFVIAGTQMPLLMVTIRSVHEEEKAFALGVQFVMLRLFAYIPSPIMYGNVIDSTCIYWSEQCGYHGNCLLYDLVSFRYKYVGMSFLLKILAALFYGCIWLLLRRLDCCDVHLVSTCRPPQTEHITASSISVVGGDTSDMSRWLSTPAVSLSSSVLPVKDESVL